MQFEKLSSPRDISVAFLQKSRQTETPAQAAVPAEPEIKPTARERKEQPDHPVSTPQRAPAEIDPINLWTHPEVPKSSWDCGGVSDLGKPSATCEMCGRQIIRYVHHMHHPGYRNLNVGCICAGKMEGDIEKARRRERDFKNREARRETFHTRPWKRSKNGNSYLKIHDHLIVLYLDDKNGTWKYAIDNRFCKDAFATKEKAIDAAFEELEKLEDK